MAILALYVPKPHELTDSITIIAIAYLVLCGLAYRMKLSVILAAVLMAVGCGIAIAPDICSAVSEDLGGYGDMARDWSKTNHSDAFFAITSYMYVGRGKLLAFAGMSVALVSHASIVAIKKRRHRQVAAGQPSVSPEIQNSQLPSDGQSAN